MIALWASEYVGIPYKLHGRTKEGCDCWGIVRLILQEQFGVEVPSLADYEEDIKDFERAVDSGMAIVDAKEMPAPEIGDVVLLRILGKPCHVGIYAGEGLMIHTLMAHDSALDHVFGLRWKNRIEGFYRVR